MRLRQLAPTIQEAGLQISRELGYQELEAAKRLTPEPRSNRLAEPAARVALAASFR